VTIAATEVAQSFGLSESELLRQAMLSFFAGTATASAWRAV
jgi:hypothetical protein